MSKIVIFAFLILFLFFVSQNTKEHFDDQVSYERQQRAGPMNKGDEMLKKAIDSEFPTISTYFVPFKRFFVEIFEDINFSKPITSLRDSTEQFLLVRTHKPIKSIRIRSIPNDHWRYLQFFTVGIFLEKDRSKGLVLHVPEGSQSIDYKINDTTQNEDWLNTNDSKIIYYTTNYYDPMLDLKL